MAAHVLVLKKYPNRRVYDCAESCYTTAKEIAKVVESGVDFSVTDARTKADVTGDMVLTIIGQWVTEGRMELTCKDLRELMAKKGIKKQS